jgi:DNA-directed RNA polymerase specialized sigma24 family protein
MAAGNRIRSQRAGPEATNGAAAMAVQEPAEQSHPALHAANEQRTMEATGRNRKLAATALMRLGADCPPEWEDVATEVILHSQYSWSEIADRLGVPRGQVIYRFHRLLIAANVDDGSSSPRSVPGD